MSPKRNLLVTCAASGFLVFSCAEASERLSHDITPQPLAQALSEFAAQTGLQLVYVSGVAATQASKGAPRGLPAAEALGHLLADTGLRFEFLNQRTIRIFEDSSCNLPPGCVGPPLGVAALAPVRLSARRSPPDSLEEVIVAGTRWWLDPTVGVAPVTVLDRRDLERGGESSIGDVLQALPMSTGSPLNTNANAFPRSEPRTEAIVAGDGSSRFSIHDLPTVVLLNGRRLPHSGLGADASVDLNTLPMSMIERVEVLVGGASAAYGSDAVGGVVNVVTRPSQHGVELRGSRTITGRNDGESITGQAVIGFDLFGGAWDLGVDYVDQDGVTMDRRGYSALPLIIIDGSGTLRAVGFSNLPRDGRFFVPEGNALGLEPGHYTHVPNTTGESRDDYRPYLRERDGFNPAPFNYLQTPNKRTSVWLLGSRPLSESANFFVEGFAQHRESAQQAAPAPYWTSLGVPTDAGIPADSYYNPFGVDVANMARRLVEAGNRRIEQDVDLWRTLIGLDGHVDRWTWELTLQGTQSKAVSVEKGFFVLERLVSALGPSGAADSGRIVCGQPDPSTGRVPAANIVRDCVPLDIFGEVGSITEDQLAYVMPRPFINHGTNEQRLAEFVLSGPGGRMMGRDLQWVLGGNYRREAGSRDPDPLRATEPFLMQPIPELSGVQDARELFAGVQVPLLHDRRWSRDMSLDVAARWSDFDSFENHIALQGGLRWQPSDQLTLRANYGEVFRAPSLRELHEPQTWHGWWADGLDPCGIDPTPAQQANCAANGVPDGKYIQDDSGFPVLVGGNPELEPETGYTLGAGLVYAPSWAKGISASVDYFQARQSNYITVPSPDQILFGCAERGQCEAIRRSPDGRVSQVAAPYSNVGKLDVGALDIAINWSATTRYGKLNSSLLATYLDRWDKQPPLDGAVHSYAGTFNEGARPRWRALGHIDWQSGPWSASYAAEYIGSYSETVWEWGSFGIWFDPFMRRVEPILYHDIEAGFRFDSGVMARAAITNVTDEDPPYLNVAPANTDVATYRLLGRSYFLEFRYQLP